MTISEDLIRLLDDWTLGTIATVNKDGIPNLSPKGTFIVVDESTLAFAEMRSPNTVRNLRDNPNVAVNIVDAFARSGAIFNGTARFVAKGEPDYENLFPRFHAIWGDAYAPMFNGIVIINVTSSRAVTSPAYDIGGEEKALRRQWLENFTKMQERLLDE